MGASFGPKHKPIKNLNPGPAQYDTVMGTVSPIRGGTISNAKKPQMWGSKTTVVPGPACYNTDKGMVAKKVTIGLPQTVKIDLCPGVCHYDASPVLRRSPSTKIPTAKKPDVLVGIEKR